MKWRKQMEKFDKIINVTQSSMPPIEEFKEMISDIWESKWLTNNGKFHEDLKLRLNDYLKVSHSELFSNGHLALEIAIKALDLKGEVITTPFTFASTTHAIVNNGLVPVFCDINENDFTIDVNKIEQLITEKTAAIIPVHVFGYPCNIEKIQEIADKYNLKVIYDSAHAFGVEISNIGIGNFGDISMFSCHATKVYHTIEGGILTFNNEELKRKLYLLKNFGISGPETVELIGINSKMNEFQAIMGILNLKYIDENIEKRKMITKTYRDCLKNINGIRVLEDIDGVKHNYSYFPILVDENVFGINRDILAEKLKEYNVICRKYFYPLITDFDCYRDKYNSNNTPIAKKVADQVLTLPIYSELELNDVKKICELMRKIKNEK
jgi:dTDP-4-amino-4,6-dideoxygalactose transaminase